MKRIKEIKKGNQSFYIIDEIIGDTVVNTKTVFIKPCISTYKKKTYYFLYDTKFNVIDDVYDFMNRNTNRKASNSKQRDLYTLRYLYIFAELIDKKISDLKEEDFISLTYFLTGISVVGEKYQFELLTSRSSSSINIMFCTYRKFYKYLNNKRITTILEDNFAQYTPARTSKTNHQICNEVPKFISQDEYRAIISYIRNNMQDKVRQLRAECIVRILWDTACRIGELLGTTLEDYVPVNIGGEEKCLIYLRERTTDKEYQKDKGCMKVHGKSDYHHEDYSSQGVGYQLLVINMDLYDLLCEYIDIVHDNAYKKHRKNYLKHKADAIGEYKAKNLDNFYVFLNNRGEPMSDEAWNKELRDIFKNVGIEVDKKRRKNNLNHRFRHGSTMYLIHDLKLPRHEVQRKLRHRNFNSLEAYYNPTTAQLVKMKEEIEEKIKSEIKGDDDIE